MTRLSRATLAVGSPYGTALTTAPLRLGVVHLGIGAFYRAHGALMTEDAMLGTGEDRWGITAVTQRSDTVQRQLLPQDGLFTVTERGAGARRLRVVGSVHDVLDGLTQADTVVDRIAAEDTAVVTLTITEKGYRTHPTGGGLDVTDPEVRADLAGRPPRTAIGQLTLGLLRRAERGGGPLTVVPCDNLPANGALTERLVHDFASRMPAPQQRRLLDHLDAAVRFPSTMVDRIVPATTDADLDAVEAALGLRDEGGVVAEPFLQWVVEDDFAGPRPRWESAGAQLVHDVAPWEAAKLRLLNATHSLLAYLGEAAGHRTIAQSVNDEAIGTAARRLMLEDALPSLTVPVGMDGPAYVESLLVRFANPALGHTVAKVGSDGSQKIGPRLLATVRARIAQGATPRWAALAVAAWMRHVATTPVADLDDPLAEPLTVRLPGDRDSAAVVPALMGAREVFDPELGADDRLAALLTDWYRVLASGPDALRTEVLR